MRPAPCIYNLFPLLLGPVPAWTGQLARIAAMGFDWVYVNPFHYPGFSGSLYAVKDYRAMNPLFGTDAGRDLPPFLSRARELGLSVMMDLVVNHTARDSLLVQAHPDWFRQGPDGSLLSPKAKDEAVAEGFVEWGDLAEIDHGAEAPRAALVEHFASVCAHYLDMGFSGFRCDAAHRVAPAFWRALTERVRARHADAVFAAETLGCTPDEAAAVAHAGFDYLFNSAKWWDFRQDWYFEQYDRFRAILPSIAFPESHDTERLAAEAKASADPLAYCRQRLIFAAFASAGWMVPIGCEFGFSRRLDVVATRPDHWEAGAFDLSPLIATLNRVRQATPALRREGRLERLAGPGGGGDVLVLRRWDETGRSFAVFAANLAERPSEIDIASLLGPVEEATGAADPLAPRFAPLETRLLLGSLDRPGAGAGPVPPPTAAIWIEAVEPVLDNGRHPVKREVGDWVEVSADILKDGHDVLAARLLYREESAPSWSALPMAPIGDDRWAGRFRLARNTRYLFTVEAWTDRFESWRAGAALKLEAGQAVALELIEGQALLAGMLDFARPERRPALTEALAALDIAETEEVRAAILFAPALREAMKGLVDPALVTALGRNYRIVADRRAARFSSWYEMVPRSQGTDPGRGATFADCARRLPDIAAMGFDVVYLTPIHPVGRLHRKGPDNSLVAGPDDPGSFYAVGAAEGGHDAVHPDLGGIEGFRAFRDQARAHGLEIALDLAFQCAPDHPWVTDHPEWFSFRPDGTIRHAENPPKKYQDIVNFDFWCADRAALWQALADLVRFWAKEGVAIFRVDNPHTKPLAFWEWLIGEIQKDRPDIIFLAEAFTRPKMMKGLAKAGFTQGYTYFTWRNFKEELTDYMTELAHGRMRDYFRPHFFPATPDILPAFLQTGGRPAFAIRAVLAATLSSLWGVYNGFELCENEAVPGTEEYLHSEKYQFKARDWDAPGNIKPLIAKLNAIRRENPALQHFATVRFLDSGDPSVLFFAKEGGEGAGAILVAVNLDPFDVHQAALRFPLAEMGLAEADGFEVEDLLSGARHLWRGSLHRLRLDPAENPAAIFRIRAWRRVSWHDPCT